MSFVHVDRFPYFEGVQVGRCGYSEGGFVRDCGGCKTKTMIRRRSKRNGSSSESLVISLRRPFQLKPLVDRVYSVVEVRFRNQDYRFPCPWKVTRRVDE